MDKMNENNHAKHQELPEKCRQSLAKAMIKFRPVGLAKKRAINQSLTPKSRPPGDFG